MSWVFKKHYTPDEARALLPQVKQWLDQLSVLRERLANHDKEISRLLGLGDDLGGERINNYVRALSAIKPIVQKFNEHQIQIKDLDRGLIDFPAFVGGKEVFLCWEKGEDDIEFWHDLESGYAGREPLEE